MSTVSVVTGANSGIGRATAIHLASQGHDVYGTIRDIGRAGKLQNMAADAGVEVKLVNMDVADDESVRKGMAEILGAAGRVDVLVNNAGVGANSVIEETTTDAMLDVFNVNVNGAVRCIREVLPGMRERGEGAIVNVTSVAGRFGAIAQAPYVASKWAFEGLSEELAFELAPFGIRVVIVEPGVTKSAIFAKNVDAPNSTGAYDDHYRRLFDFYAAGMAQSTDPFEVAALIHQAVTTDKPQLRYACSWGGPEIIAGRQAMSDEDWVALGAIADDTEYESRFRKAFGVDITNPAPEANPFRQ
jgi:NAD(P)-dependent dehydrogenase (short-subunit alcohol dehydrogenase family)